MPHTDGWRGIPDLEIIRDVIIFGLVPSVKTRAGIILIVAAGPLRPRHKVEPRTSEYRSFAQSTSLDKTTKWKTLMRHGLEIL